MEGHGWPLTAYPQHPMTPGDGFEGKTANSDYYFQNPNVEDNTYGLNANHRPIEDGPNVRRGEPPARQPRRSKNLKRVDLYQGNFILDCPVPPRFLNTLPNKKNREFTHMRYTAATCDPADFKKERFTLRQVLYEQARATEMFIVITLYNEDEVLFARTMHGVMKNIAHLCSKGRSKLWGKEGWREVVVCVVADGRTKYDLVMSLLTLGLILVHWPCWLQWAYTRMVSPRTLSMANQSQLISSNTQPKLVLIHLWHFGSPTKSSLTIGVRKGALCHVK